MTISIKEIKSTVLAEVFSDDFGHSKVIFY